MEVDAMTFNIMMNRFSRRKQFEICAALCLEALVFASKRIQVSTLWRRDGR